MATKTSLYDRNVCGPEALEMPGNVENHARIAAWWERAKLYAEAMDDLGRAVILKKNDDETWYLASVESKL